MQERVNAYFRISKFSYKKWWFQDYEKDCQVSNVNRNARQARPFMKDTERYSIISNFSRINFRCDFV